MSRQSRSPHTTSSRNCPIILPFLGPLHTTLSPRSRRRKPILIQQSCPLVDSVESRQTGIQPELDWWMCRPSRPSIRGIDGPVKSMSRTPTRKPLRYNIKASCNVIDDLPTPDCQCLLLFRDRTSFPAEYENCMFDIGICPCSVRFRHQDISF